MTKVFSNLVDSLTEAGVNFTVHGNDAPLPKQVQLDILEEQGDSGVVLYFNINEQGHECFVCQE